MPRAQTALHDRRRRIDPTLADGCRCHAGKRRWPTAEQLTDLAEAIDEAPAAE